MTTTVAVSEITEVNHLHREICMMGKATVTKAIRVGELVAGHRRKIGHGDWSDFAESSYPFSLRTAQRYVLVFENKDKLEAENIFDLTDAYKKLSDSPEKHQSQDTKTTLVSRASPDLQRVTSQKATFSEPEPSAPERPRVTTPVAVKPHDVTPPKPPIELDSVGWVIPKDALPFWHRRQEVQDLMTAVSRVKSAIEKAKADNDDLFAYCSNGAIADLSKAYAHLSNAKPYAVCTQCQGSFTAQPKGCSMCSNTGLISQWKWDTHSRKEIKEIRLKQIQR